MASWLARLTSPHRLMHAEERWSVNTIVQVRRARVFYAGESAIDAQKPSLVRPGRRFVTDKLLGAAPVYVSGRKKGWAMPKSGLCPRLATTKNSLSLRDPHEPRSLFYRLELYRCLCWLVAVDPAPAVARLRRY